MSPEEPTEPTHPIKWVQMKIYYAEVEVNEVKNPEEVTDVAHPHEDPAPAGIPAVEADPDTYVCTAKSRDECPDPRLLNFKATDPQELNELCRSWGCTHLEKAPEVEAASDPLEEPVYLEEVIPTCLVLSRLSRNLLTLPPPDPGNRWIWNRPGYQANAPRFQVQLQKDGVISEMEEDPEG